MRFFPFILSLMFLANTASAEIELSLEKAITMAAEHSFDIKQQQNKLSSAEFDFRTARSSRFPTMSIDAVMYYNDAVASIDIPFLNQPIEMGSKDNYQFDLKFSVPVFTGGKINNQIKIGDEMYKVGSFNLEAEKMASAYNVRKAFFTYLLTRAINKSAQASLSRIEIILNDVGNLHLYGLADSIDILESELAYHKANDISQKQFSAENNALNVLKSILGLSAENKVIITDLPRLPSQNDIKRIDEMSDINRAELRALDKNIQAADYYARLKKADYYPDIGAYVGYSYGMPNKDFVDPEWNDNIIMGVALNWDFNIGGKTKHNVNSAKFKTRALQMAKAKLEESFRLQYEIAAENIEFAYRTIFIAQKEFEIAGKKYNLAKEKQNQGSLSVNRLLEMETELTFTEQLYQASIINYYLAKTDLLYAAGSPDIYGGL